MNKVSLNAVKLGLGKLCLIALMLFSVAGCVTQQQQDKDEQNVKARAKAHTDLGAAYFQQRNLEVALSEFKEAAKIDPNYGLAYNGLGLVHSALGQYDLAEANFKRALQIDPNNSETHNNYGGFLCSISRIDESINEFMAAVKNPLYATPAIAYTNAGICATRKQDAKSAEQYFQIALQIDPLMNATAYQLATIQFNRNDAKAAKNTLQNVMLNQPSPEMLWLAIQIERALGGKDEEASYALQLRRQYPNSEQAKLLQSGK